jgi:site-specific recombinase XerD
MKSYWIDLIDDFLYEKFVNEWLSLHTIKTYTTVFNLFILSPLFSFNDFNLFNEYNFKKFLWDNLIKNKWSSWSYNCFRKNLKVFCNYLIKKWKIKENPLNDIKPRKTEKCLPKYLNTEQIRELKKVIDNTFTRDTFLDVRNKTILYFYLFSWLRLSELINLKIEDINFEENTIKVNKWKWKKDRLVPLINILYKKLVFYFKIRKVYWLKTNILFPTFSFNFPLLPRDIYYIFDKIKTKLSFYLTPHMLRHTFATELVRKNANFYDVSRSLWHSKLSTTQIYVWLDVKAMCESFNKLSLFR